MNSYMRLWLFRFLLSSYPYSGAVAGLIRAVFLFFIFFTSVVGIFSMYQYHVTISSMKYLRVPLVCLLVYTVYIYELLYSLRYTFYFIFYYY